MVTDVSSLHSDFSFLGEYPRHYPRPPLGSPFERFVKLNACQQLFCDAFLNPPRHALSQPVREASLLHLFPTNFPEIGNLLYLNL